MEDKDNSIEKHIITKEEKKPNFDNEECFQYAGVELIDCHAHIYEPSIKKEYIPIMLERAKKSGISAIFNVLDYDRNILSVFRLA